jgi:hypothetical protein
LLIPVFGIYGAAFTSGIASGVLCFSLVLFAWRKIRENGGEPGPTASVGLPTDPDMLYH